MTPGRHRCLAVDAVVRAVDTEGFADLELDLNSRCAGCAGLCTWRRPETAERFRVRANVPVEPGTAVRVTLPADRVLSGALWLHGLPLAALLAGGAFGAAVGGSDAATLAGALGGLAAAAAATRGLRRRAEESTLARARLEPR